MVVTASALVRQARTGFLSGDFQGKLNGLVATALLLLAGALAIEAIRALRRGSPPKLPDLAVVGGP